MHDEIKQQLLRGERVTLESMDNMLNNLSNHEPHLP